MEYEKTVASLGGAVATCAIWEYIPGHEQFALRLKILTSLTGEPEKSPLAFVEHYHYGLASLIAGRKIKKYSPYFDGFGVGMIASEAVSPNPFGTGKTEWEWKGNITLTTLLSGLLLISICE